MHGYYCINCHHEFPAEGAIKRPERASMIIMVSIGLLVAATGVGLLVLALTTQWLASEWRGKFITYGLLAVVLGVVFAGAGRSVGQGVYAHCPKCGLARGFPADSPDARNARRKAGERPAGAKK